MINLMRLRIIIKKMRQAMTSQTFQAVIIRKEIAKATNQMRRMMTIKKMKQTITNNKYYGI